MVHYDLISDYPKKATRSILNRMFSPLTTGGVRQSMFTLISAAIGGGILCLPYVFSMVGLFNGILLLGITAWLAFLTMRMLLLSAVRTNIFSYGKLFAHATGSRLAGPVLDCITISFGFGVVVAYFVFLGDFVPPIFELAGIQADRNRCILGTCCFAIPFVFPHRLSALRNITPIATLALVFTSLVVFCKSFGFSFESGPVEYFKYSPSVLKAFTIAVSSFICHTNVVSVAGELISPSHSRADKVAFRAAFVQLAMYLTISVCGYISFGDSIQQNFIRNYSDDDKLITACRIVLTFTIFFGLPMNTNPTAKALVNLLQTVKQDSSGPLLPASPSESTDPMPRVRISTGIVVLISGSLISLKVPGVADVISILGGSFGTLIMLVFPVVIYASVFREEMQQIQNKICVIMVVTAAIICFVAVGLSISGLV
jgi:amino acid permease